MNRQTRQQPEPMLRFSPYAWAKLVFMRDCSENEVGAFGIADPEDLLFIEDIVIVKQKVSMVTVAFDDIAVGDFFEQQVDFGRKPEQFARIWVHTHPGSSPSPSSTDEQTFQRVFGSCNWSLMFIISRDGNSFARLRFGVGPGGQINIPVAVDYSMPFQGSDFAAWQQEYKENVTEECLMTVKPEKELGFGAEAVSCNDPEDILDQIDLMHPSERQQFMDELSIRSDFWDEEDWL